MIRIVKLIYYLISTGVFVGVLIGAVSAVPRSLMSKKVTHDEQGKNKYINKHKP